MNRPDEESEDETDPLDEYMRQLEQTIPTQSRQGERLAEEEYRGEMKARQRDDSEM